MSSIYLTTKTLWLVGMRANPVKLICVNPSRLNASSLIQGFVF